MYIFAIDKVVYNNDKIHLSNNSNLANQKY
jgi:hypothetical protein